MLWPVLPLTFDTAISNKMATVASLQCNAIIIFFGTAAGTAQHLAVVMFRLIYATHFPQSTGEGEILEILLLMSNNSNESLPQQN